MSSIRTAISLLKTPGKMIMPIADRGLFNWLPDKTYLKLVYRAEMGKKLNLEHPKTFNEKMQWLKLYDRNPLYQQLVDKYNVKRYIADMIGKDYIIPTIGLWNSVEEIPFDQLPDQFVLKCTHDSGSVIVCKDKKTFDIDAAKAKLSSHMKKSTYWFGREWPYRGLIPRIITEPYLKDNNVEDSESQDLADYKVHCFNGVPKMVLVCRDRFSIDGVTEDFFDIQWNHLPVRRPDIKNAEEDVSCPEELSEMLSISQEVSKNIPFLRVDFYIVNRQLYIGELTFFPAGGFKPFLPESFDMEMGSWIQLPIRGVK